MQFSLRFSCATFQCSGEKWEGSLSLPSERTNSFQLQLEPSYCPVSTSVKLWNLLSRTAISDLCIASHRVNLKNALITQVVLGVCTYVIWYRSHRNSVTLKCKAAGFTSLYREIKVNDPARGRGRTQSTFDLRVSFSSQILTSVLWDVAFPLLCLLQRMWYLLPFGIFLSPKLPPPVLWFFTCFLLSCCQGWHEFSCILNPSHSVGFFLLVLK